jgi:hypothetical protein
LSENHFVKYCLPIIALLALATPPLHAADGLSGAWTADRERAVQTFVFKTQSDDRFGGIVCGPCDDPSAVFRIEDGRMNGDSQITFFIAYDVGGPLFQKFGAYRDQVTATRSGDQWTLRAQRLGGAEAPVTTVLKRVVAGYEGLTSPRATASSPRAGSKPSPIEGKWVAAGRNTQQNFILKIRDNKVWGLICGPCTPEGIFLIDDGAVDGNNVTFYINHLDTPPSARKTGVNRNLMRGTLTGNVMKFTWVREGAEDQPGGEMTLIGPIR